jgi:hypothetical protein
MKGRKVKVEEGMKLLMTGPNKSYTWPEARQAPHRTLDSSTGTLYRLHLGHCTTASGANGVTSTRATNSFLGGRPRVDVGASAGGERGTRLRSSLETKKKSERKSSLGNFFKKL